MKSLYRIDDGESTATFTRTSIVRANNNDRELSALLRQMSVGESVSFGGGAAARYIITRVQ